MDQCNILINLLSEYNDHNIIAALLLKPQKIVFIRFGTDKYREAFEDIRKFLVEKMPYADIVDSIVDATNVVEIQKILGLYNSSETFINISGGTRLMGILFYEAALRSGMKPIYIDVQNKRFIQFGQNGHLEIEKEIPELTVEDFIASTGGQVVTDASKTYDRAEYVELINFLVEDYQLWKDIKELLVNKKRVAHMLSDPMKVSFKLSYLSPYVKGGIHRFIDMLAQRHMVNILRMTEDYIEVDFRDQQTKNFVMITGSWLEALTYKTVKEIREVDDARSGVRFIWDDDAREVENELDVLAVVDASLTCISCKDTDNYDVAQLNELAVYSQRVGGEAVKKIMVTTAPPKKRTLIQRAREMDIHIVVFEGDVGAFKKQLNDFI